MRSDLQLLGYEGIADHGQLLLRGVQDSPPRHPWPPAVAKSSGVWPSSALHKGSPSGLAPSKPGSILGGPTYLEALYMRRDNEFDSPPTRPVSFGLSSPSKALQYGITAFLGRFIVRGTL